MADWVLSPLVDAAIGTLASTLIEKGRMILQVNDDLDDLSNTLSRIQVLLADAEERQITDRSVKMWLGELKDVAYDADDVLDEIGYEALRREAEGESNKGERKQVRSFFPSCSCFGLRQVRSKLDVATRIKDINERIEKIHKGKDKFSFREGDGRRVSEPIDQLRLTTSLLTVPETEILGRDKDRDEIIKLLLSDDFCGEKQASVISIVGMGGLGKTTLAQRVYNDQNVVNHFDIRAWVCVSEDFNILRLTKEILNSATRLTPKKTDGSARDDGSALDRMQRNLQDTLDGMQRKLQDTLKGQRFLIVLDDVWNEKRSAWEKLEAPFRVGAKGSKIIATTRGDAVSKSMNTNHLYRLEHLGYQDCLSLFLRYAFAGDNFDAYPKLMKIGKELVERRCQGLPLAVKALGSLLSSKRELNFWERILNSQIWSSMDDTSEVTTAMRVSYHHLPPHIKQCFAFCSIFPKDYKFGKDELVGLWIAQGFIYWKECMTLEETGSEYFDFLLSRSFFERERNMYKMHDCVHDLAESISRDECFRIERGKPTHILKKGHRHSSLIVILDDDTRTINFEDLCKCKGMRTFILQHNYSSLIPEVHDMKFLRHLLVNFRYLRVLVFSKLEITELPDSICNLKHLRYLDLSWTEIMHLPEAVSRFYNLQTLKLDFCMKLRQLPNDTRKLVNLRHLYLDGCESLEGMPSEIGGLTCLQTLSRFVVGRESGSRIGELKGLTELKGAISIAKLQNVADAKEAEEVNLKNRASIDGLQFSWDDEEDAEKTSQCQASFEEEESEKILEALQPHSDIKKLSIKGYRGNNYPSWLQDATLPSLGVFTLKGCTNLNLFPPLGQFYKLSRLEVSKMRGVKCIGHEFYGDKGTTGFPSLEDLLIEDMSNLEEWREVEGGTEFPSLKSVVIRDCPKLKKIPNFFPTVEVLILWNCHQLACLPRLPSVHVLGLNDCNEILLRWVSDLTSLSDLSIGGFKELRSLPEEMLQPLGNLKTLEISWCDKLVCLVEEDKGLPPTLASLHISWCDNLKSLPKRMQRLTSLKDLVIFGCPELVSLPEEGLPGTLESLDILGCEKLRERCRKEDGEDWAKILHIPHVMIDGETFS